MQIFTSGMKGKKHSEETKARIRATLLKREALVKELLAREEREKNQDSKTATTKLSPSPVYSNEDNKSSPPAPLEGGA